MYKIVLTGGGTGGHVIPNLALIPYLRKSQFEIHYVGSNNPERELTQKHNITFHSINSIKFDRIRIFANLKIPFVLLKAIKQAKLLLQKINPTIIFSKGGYVSLPTCFAARALKIPIVIHESDTSLGLANKITSRFANLVITSFKQTKKGKYIGNPIRDEIFLGDKLKAQQRYNIHAQKPVILIIGGSSGSTAINQAVYTCLPNLTKTYTVIHICGKYGKTDKQMPSYIQIEYANDINDLFALADIVVSRGGANALSELMALGKKTLVIPLPKTASRGDQIENALAYKERKHLIILEQQNLTAQKLQANIQKLHKMPLENKTKKTYGVNQEIVNNIISVIKEQEKTKIS